jgi:polysaccharide lyase family 4-like protein
MRNELLRLALVGSLSLGVPAGAYSASITGAVRFGDDPPKLPAVKVTKDQDYCGETLPNETYVIESNGGLRNVVVFIEPAPPGRAADAQKDNFLYNEGCRYAPRVMALQRGERLRVKSNDPKLHIPHGYLGDKTVFNLALPFKGTSLDATSRIRQPGILKVVCDTHAWMRGFVHVFDHPYFAVTDEQGAFSIPDLPAGTYTLKAWHEDGGVKSQEINVADVGEVRVNFEFNKK